jgi:uncharacterized protein DUF6252
VRYKKIVMKNLKLIFRMFAFIAMVSLSSCTGDVEPIDPYVLNPNITECATPTSFSSTAIADTNITLTWTSGGDFWEVEYGPAGFAHGQGSLVPSGTMALIIQGLNVATEYDFYVRTNCGSLTSEWIGPISADETLVVDPDPNPNPQTGFFKVDFNNQTFNASTVHAYIINGSTLISGVRGTQGETFSFILNGATTGTYNSDEDLMIYNPSATAEYDYSNFADVDPAVNTGEVIITEINTTNHTISGTFHYTGYWSDFTLDPPAAPIEFTNGSFTIPYETSAVNPGDIFTAKIDGTQFTPNVIASGSFEFGSDTWLTLTGQAATGEVINVNFKEGTTAGTYNITGNIATDVVQGIYTNAGDEDFDATSGSVTISSITATHIVGTFQFTVFDAVLGTHQITQGSFDMDY